MQKNPHCVLATAFAISLAASNTQRPGLFGFDSCADVSIVNDPSMLTDAQPYLGVKVQGVSGIAVATHVGTLNLKIPCDNGSFWNISLPHVIVIP